MATLPPASTSPLEALDTLRGDFGPNAAARKRRALSAANRLRFTTARALARLHDELLFLAAFPDSADLAADARRLLDGIAARVAALPPHERVRLADTGIAGTTSRHTFMYGVVRWLVAHDARLVPSWPHPRHAERLDPLVRLTMLPAESDGFDDSGLSTQAWIERASHALPGGVLQWIVGGPGIPGARDLYDEAEVPVTWHLGDSPWSTSRARVAAGSPVARSAFRRTPRDPCTWVTAPLPGIRRLTGDDARTWCDASLAALVARCREVVPTTYANPHEVYLADLGEGCALCIIGAHPGDRLALEANYGYVMFSNGIPIGYGGVTPLANQANTGANIFESFRGSEAAFLFAQALRAFRTLFGISRFLVNPYQFGAGNDEALQSGAYWFYDRLGFRPVDPAVAALAARERERLAAHRGARSSLPTLRRLARGDLVLELDADPGVPRFDERGLAIIGAEVAAWLGGVSAGDREAHVLRVAAAQKADLTGRAAPLTAAERRGARLLSPVLALTAPAWPAWTPAERGAAWELVATKGHHAERDFARRSRRHVALWDALRRLVARRTGQGARAR